MKICLLGQSKTKTNLKQKFTESVWHVGQSKQTKTNLKQKFTESIWHVGQSKNKNKPETKLYRVNMACGTIKKQTKKT